MMPISRVLLGACLTALRYLFFGISVLLLVLTVVRHVRADEGAGPAELVLLAGLFGGLGWLAGWGRGKLGI